MMAMTDSILFAFVLILCLHLANQTNIVLVFDSLYCISFQIVYLVIRFIVMGSTVYWAHYVSTTVFTFVSGP